MLAADYPFLDVFWTMILFFAWVVWIWIIVAMLSDIFSRRDIIDGAMSGTPRRRSLKRVVPQSSSRRTSAVQREQTISAAIATGQNWP